MRKFIRHPSDVPIQLQFDEYDKPEVEPLLNVSLNGLSFHSSSEVPVGTWLKICIPTVDPPFLTTVRVVWCRARDQGYDLGVELPNATDAFRTRMVEQICHIENYRKEVQDKEGRTLSSEEAAMEWIEKFGADFPALSESS